MSGLGSGVPCKKGVGLVSMGPIPAQGHPLMVGVLWLEGVYNSQLRRRRGQMKRLHRERVAATPTPPVTATITQW